MTAVSTAEPLLTPRAGGGYTVTLDGREIGHVRRLGCSWVWHVAGDASWGDSRRTRTEAVAAILRCLNTRAIAAADVAHRAAYRAAQDEALRADGYEPADVAEVAPGAMVRAWRGHARGYGAPVLAVRAHTFDHDGAVLVHTHLTGHATPTGVMMLPDRGVMVRRDRTPAAERAWARWLDETDESPEACAARAVPDGWIPGGWDDLGEGDTIRVPVRVRHERVYEWSDPRAVLVLDRYPDGRVFLAYAYTDHEGQERYHHEAFHPLVTAHGVLRPAT